jgi:hypothetical protein
MQMILQKYNAGTTWLLSGHPRGYSRTWQLEHSFWLQDRIVNHRVEPSPPARAAMIQPGRRQRQIGHSAQHKLTEGRFVQSRCKERIVCQHPLQKLECSFIIV